MKVRQFGHHSIGIFGGWPSWLHRSDRLLVSSKISCLNHPASCAASLGVSPVEVNRHSGRNHPPKPVRSAILRRLHRPRVHPKLQQLRESELANHLGTSKLSWYGCQHIFQAAFMRVYKLWRFKELSYWWQNCRRGKLTLIFQHKLLYKQFFWGKFFFPIYGHFLWCNKLMNLLRWVGLSSEAPQSVEFP